jgi:hypothetical protein
VGGEEGKKMATAAAKPVANKAKKKQKKVSTSSVMAIHANEGDTHIVGIGNLRVIVCNDGGFWFAQGLEIDYASDGRSFEEVKSNFEEGLKATISQHLQVYQNIEKLLIPAPAKVWQELASVKKHLRFSQVSRHNDIGDADLSHLPYSGIDFYVDEKANQVAA